MTFLLIYSFLLIFKKPIFEAKKNSERNENNQAQCYPNFFWDNGECKDCPFGYFGTNCSTSCPYPSYGKICGETCNCKATVCDHVIGCHENGSEFEIITESKISPVIYSNAETTEFDNQNDTKTMNLRVPVIIVGCILIFLMIVNGVEWISKSTRNSGSIEISRDDIDLNTIYQEMNEISENQ